LISYFRAKPGWHEIVVPRATVILEGSPQPGVPRNPWKLEPALALAARLTTVPTGKNAEQAPAPFPLVMVQLMPLGCEIIVPLPLPPGTIEMLPFAKAEAVRTVRIP
jgi:hypothetical protein